MANQREMDEIPLSFDEGRLAFLGDIPLDAEKQDIASFIHDQGFKSVVLYWLSERFEPMELKHQGYCMAEFLLRNEAQKVIKELPDGIFKGRHLKATVPGHKVSIYCSSRQIGLTVRSNQVQTQIFPPRRKPFPLRPMPSPAP
jgi:hypothetical protein